MKEIICEKMDASTGYVKVVLRVHEKIVYVKTNNNQYVAQMIAQMEAKGAVINRSRSGGWLRINIFSYEKIGDDSNMKLGNTEFDLNITPVAEVDRILVNFFKQSFINAGFTCSDGELGAIAN